MKTNLASAWLGATLWALCVASSHAAGDTTVYAGPAAVRFNVDSKALAGPAGTTPPGVTIAIDNTSTLGLVLTRSLDPQWSVSLLAGVPPVLHFKGDGAAAALGEVGSARAWFPTLTLDWSPGSFGAVRPFVGAGFNYTTFSQARVNDSYNAAFGGSASHLSLKAGIGAAVRLGADLKLSERLVLQASYARYGIRTTADVTTDTVGLGPITRSLTLRSDPDIFALLLGYRF